MSHRAQWLFRTLHAAELAGLDPAEVLGSAIAAQDLAGARDIAAVLDARIRPRIQPLLPQPQGPWASRVPQLPDPACRAYLTQIAAMMDDRTRRLGQHLAQYPGQRQRQMTPRENPGWAALGDTLPSWWAQRPDGILRPPKPEITASAKVLHLAADHDIEPEAANQAIAATRVAGLMLEGRARPVSRSCPDLSPARTRAPDTLGRNVPGTLRA